VDDTVTRLVGGFKGKVADNWEWQGGLMYMRDAVSNVDGGASIRSLLRNAIRGTTVATAYNPFGAFSGAPRGGDQNAVINTFRGLRLQNNAYDMWLGDLTVNNSNVMKLWAGDLGIAGGAEIRREKISQVRDPASANGDFAGSGGGTNLFGSRRANSFFAELSTPLVKKVELSVAGRYEDYSDFGTAFKPQYSISARPLRWALVRGSYSEGFRAPALIQLFSAQSVGFAGGPTVDPKRRNPENPSQQSVSTSLRLVRGGNANLSAENSRSYYGGIVVEPTGGLFKGFSFSADWSNIYIYDRIQLPSTAVSLNENDPAIVVRAPPTAQDNALGQPGELVELRLTFQNLAKRYSESLDFGANYRWNSDRFGRFSAEWRGSWLYKFVTQSAKSNPKVENRGSTSLPEWRWVGTVDWRRKSWSASFTTNYVGKNDAFYQPQAIAKTLPTTWIDLGPWTTYDVQVGYDLPWLKSTRVTAGVLNATDRPPPFYDGNAEGYDPLVANPFGAMYYLRLTKKF
jgi:outer membrane receptor protein involved in Fe transport